VQLVSGIDDALLIRRRELLRAQGRRRLMVLLAVVGTLAALAGYKLLEMSSAFAVDTVSVQGAPPRLEKQIQSAVEAQAGGHNLLAIDRGRIADSLSQMPYIRSVSVNRAFPHTLAVTVRVERPAMVVAVGKLDYLVSEDGRVLEQRTSAPGKVPVVSLPDGTTLVVGSKSGDANVHAALAVLAAAPEGFQGKVGHIRELTASSGTVSALIGTHIKLRLGTPDDLALKLEVVERVMRRISGQQRHNLAYIDVSAPGRPAYGMRSTLPSSAG
jgi:cell division protein FtsQ